MNATFGLRWKPAGNRFSRLPRSSPGSIPTGPAVAFLYQSWLLNPPLERMLLPESNLLRFQPEPEARRSAFFPAGHDFGRDTAFPLTVIFSVSAFDRLICQSFPLLIQVS